MFWITGHDCDLKTVGYRIIYVNIDVNKQTREHVIDRPPVHKYHSAEDGLYNIIMLHVTHFFFSVDRNMSPYHINWYAQTEKNMLFFATKTEYHFFGYFPSVTLKNKLQECHQTKYMDNCIKNIHVNRADSWKIAFYSKIVNQSEHRLQLTLFKVTFKKYDRSSLTKLRISAHPL